jgi:hypothetical protein
MNCHDINHLLDANAAEDLSRTQREAIDMHFATCRACGEDWANWREIAALPIPALSDTLRGRIAASLSAQRKAPGRRASRPFVIGSIFIVGVVVAAIIAVQLVRSDSRPVPAADASSPAVVDAAPDGEDSALSRLPAIPASGSLPAKADTPVDVPVDPRNIVVLKRPEAAADGQAIALAAQCHDAIVRQLRTVPGLKVMADADLLPYEVSSQVTRLGPDTNARPKLRPSDREMALKLGAGNVLLVSTENGCSVMQLNSQSDTIIMGAKSGGRVPPAYGWEPLATSIVESIRDEALKDLPTIFAEAKATLVNTALSDADRAGALSRLHVSTLQDVNARRSAFDDAEIVAAAAQLGTKSAYAGVRQTVWAILRNVDLTDPSLVQPLLQALANDPDADVRMQAALTLNTFLDRPGVREALQRAAAEDPSRQPAASCCILTVREAAQRASIADEGFHDWVRSKLFDESLPARSRLLNLQSASPDGRFPTLSIGEFGTEASRVVFNIGRYEQDPQLRAMAWGILQRALPDEVFVPVLVGDLSNNPDEYVRASAAQVLTRYVRNPVAREALERARNDPSLAVRRIATAVPEHPADMKP